MGGGGRPSRVTVRLKSPGILWIWGRGEDVEMKERGADSGEIGVGAGAGGIGTLGMDG